jgi:hypothetical protein
MKKIVLTYGLISGAIVSALMLISIPLCINGTISMDNGMWLGYTTMVLAFSMIFFGIKNYRDNYNGGTITFGRAFRLGILIALIASLFYAITWEILYNTMASDFMTIYSEHSLKTMEAKGASATEIEQARVQMAEYAEMYKNPIVRFLMTIMEILPVGLVVTLLVAAILKRPKPVAASAL